MTVFPDSLLAAAAARAGAPVVLPGWAPRAGRAWNPIFERILYGEETAIVTERVEDDGEGTAGRGAVRLHGGLIRALEAIARA